MRVSRREAERLPSTRRALNVWSRNLRWSWNCLLHTCSYYLFQCQETDKTANLQTNRLPHIQELNSPLSTAATSMGSWFHRNLSFDPISSVGKESTCNAGDPFLIPWSGRSAGEGIGYPLQYSWASLVAQMVKNQPAMRETWVLSLGWEDPLEDGMATHSSILAWRIPMDRGAWQATVHGVAKSQTQLSDFTHTVGLNAMI